jgi:hypothetical protein
MNRVVSAVSARGTSKGKDEKDVEHTRGNLTIIRSGQQAMLANQIGRANVPKNATQIGRFQDSKSPDD